MQRLRDSFIGIIPSASAAPTETDDSTIPRSNSTKQTSNTSLNSSDKSQSELPRTSVGKELPRTSVGKELPKRRASVSRRNSIVRNDSGLQKETRKDNSTTNDTGGGYWEKATKRLSIISAMASPAPEEKPKRPTSIVMDKPAEFGFQV